MDLKEHKKYNDTWNIHNWIFQNLQQWCRTYMENLLFVKYVSATGYAFRMMSNRLHFDILTFLLTYIQL
jgi:hypothetical protein